MQISTKGERLELLDVVRGVAIIAVLMVHVDQIAAKILNDTHLTIEHSSVSEFIAPFGRYGVELFFILSGYLICMLYGQESTTSKFPIGRFVSRRMRRIYPLWIVFFAVGIAESYIFGFGGWIDSITNLESSYSFLMSAFITILATATFSLFLFQGLWNTTLPGGWSIQSEVANYILYLFFGRKSLRFLLTSMCGIAFTQILVKKYLGNETIIQGFISRINVGSSFFFFCTGVLIFEATNRKGNFQSWIPKNYFNISIYLLAFFLQFELNPVFGNFKDAIASLIILWIAVVLVNKPLPLRKCVASIGRYSYFIYFAHFHILWLFYHVIRDSKKELRFSIPYFIGVREAIFISTFLLTLIMSYFLGLLSFKYFEGRFTSKAVKTNSHNRVN